MTKAHAKLYTIDPVFGHTTFLAAYTWLTSEQVFHAFRHAKALFSVEFPDAAYLVNLYLGPDKLIDSFWIDDASLKDMRKTCWTEAHLFHAAT